ncbi:MAG TPA: DUF4142 domain-containing protein [Ramlibacter sp.]|nr:DUF4142 domain-containing protein [Ramlibacter sp.]
MRIVGLLAAAVAFGLNLPAPALAQKPPAYAATAASGIRTLNVTQRLERRFLQIAASNLRFQAEGSRLALARSNNPAVKDLAQALVARQKGAQPELLHLLQARGMAMPFPSDAHSKVLKQLGKLSGAKFDRLFVDEVTRSCQADIGNFEKVAIETEDPVLKGWIERQLPMLRAHVAKAGKALPAATLRGQRAV